jgi:epoxyqueuosine reductase QueG
MRIRDILESSLRSSGIEHFAFLDEASLLAACEGEDRATLSRYGLCAPSGAPVAQAMDGAASAQSAVAVALPYGEGPELPPPWVQAYQAEKPGALCRIGRFARANWYAELVARLKAASTLARAELAAGDMDPGSSGEWRKLVNSGLPEKRIALASGLGSLGRNGLVMVPGHGSAVVLGLLILPLALEEGLGSTQSAPPSQAAPQNTGSTLNAKRSAPQSAPRISALCDGCGLCVGACPTGALSGPPLDEKAIVGFDRKLCLQHWSSVPLPSDSDELPEEVAAARQRAAVHGGDASCADLLYGCDACQEACPYFKPDPEATTERGLLGPGLPASWLLSASEAEIKAALRGSALGMSWISIEALRQSARRTKLFHEI